MKNIPLPGNTEAEEQVLACILYNPRQVSRVMDTLAPEHFSVPDLGNVYECILALVAERREPTPFNVADELVRRQLRSYEIKQVRWEMEQLSMAFAPGDIEDYMHAIVRSWRCRRAIEFARRIADAGYHQDDNLTEIIEEMFNTVVLGNDQEQISSFAQAMDRYLDEFTQRRKDAMEGRSIGIKTGFKFVDRLIGGLRPGTLNILGARTSIGKTSFALALALYAAKDAIRTGLDILFFSLEMKEAELVQRLLSMDTMIDQSLLRDGMTSQQDYEDIVDRGRALRPIGMHIADSIYRLDSLRGSARSLCARRKIGLIVVDYLQLVDLPPTERGKQQRHETIAEISRTLKRLAQELNVPVLALAQLNREAERSETPQLHHIGDSDGIGRDADLVAFLHVDTEQMVLRNKAEDYFIDFIVRKQRNGPLGTERLWFRPRQTRFEDVSEY